MLEQGLVQLINSNSAVTTLAPVGGFATQLPKDQTLPSWSYLFFGGTPNLTLLSTKGLRTRRLQIDCYGNTAADCIALAHAIASVIDGYSGTLSDPDSTWVNLIVPSEEPFDFFDDARRSYRRMLEYEVLFAQD